MPTYVYGCTKCNRTDVKLRPIADMEIPVMCPDCGVVMERMLTAVDFQRGKGWANGMPPEKPGRKG